MTPTADTSDLSALAAGLCQDAGIGVELGPRWAWDAARRVLVVAETDLRARGADWCAAVLAHEVGHYFVTRYHLFAVPFPLPEALPVLMNGLEDPRANAWIVGRYPGTARWLTRLDEEPQQPRQLRIDRATADQLDDGPGLGRDRLEAPPAPRWRGDVHVDSAIGGTG